MTNSMNFMINTGNPENDQREVARCHQHYQAQGLLVHAQPHPQGGYLITVYPPQQPQQYAQPAQPQPGYAAAPQQPQYAKATQPLAEYVAQQQQSAQPAQPQPGYAAAPQPPQYAQPAQPQPGYAAAPQPPQYSQPAQPQPGYAAAPQPPQYAQPAQPQPSYGTGPSYGAANQAPVKINIMEAIFGKLTLWQKIKWGSTLVFILGSLGWSYFMFQKTQVNVVIFENSLDTKGDLTLDGKSYGSLDPKKSLRVELKTGNYALSFTGNGKKLDEGTLVVPDRKKTGFGFHAIYNLGGKKGLGVVTKYYGNPSMKDVVRPIDEGKRLEELPGTDVLANIDEPFPQSVTVPQAATFGVVVRVCHIDEEKETVGCPGW